MPRFLAGALLALLLAGFATLAGFYALATPVGQGPDEGDHVRYATFLRQSRRLPDRFRDGIVQDHHPPLYPTLGALLAGDLARLPFPARIALPGPFAVEVGLDRPVPEAPEWPLSVFYGLRALSVALGVLALAALYAGARAAFGGRRGPALAATGLAAFLPGVPFAAAVINVDVLAVAASTAALALALRWLSARDAPRPRAGLLLGLALGAALLSKVSALALLPALALLVVLRRDLLPPALVAAGVALLLSGWWYGRNGLLYGDPLLVGAQVRTMMERVELRPSSEHAADFLLTNLFESFVGRLGAFDVSPPELVLLVLVAAGGAVFFGALVALLRRREVLEDEDLPSRRVLVFCAGAALFLLAAVLAGNRVFFSPQGRYLYPALLPLAVLAVAGLRALSGRHLFAPVAAIAVLALAGSSAATLRLELLPEYHPKRNRLGPGVAAYDDAGHARLEPRLRRGGNEEMWGSASVRRTPERNASVDPTEVVYEYDGLDPARAWRVRETLYGGDEWTKFGDPSSQALFADGLLVHAEVPVFFTPRTLRYDLPREATADGRVTLAWRRVRGRQVAVAEVALEEGAGGEGPFLELRAGSFPGVGASAWGDPRSTGLVVARLPAGGPGVLLDAALPDLPAGTWRVELRGRPGGGPPRALRLVVGNESRDAELGGAGVVLAVPGGPARVRVEAGPGGETLLESLAFFRR